MDLTYNPIVIDAIHPDHSQRRFPCICDDVRTGIVILRILCQLFGRYHPLSVITQGITIQFINSATGSYCWNRTNDLMRIVRIENDSAAIAEFKTVGLDKMSTAIGKKCLGPSTAVPF